MLTKPSFYDEVPKGYDVTQSAGHEMKIRLRADLRAAMKDRRADEAKLLRTLVAAIDNAEAPPQRANEKAADQHHFNDGTAEVERLSLGPAQVQAILMAEIQEREHAAVEMDRLGRADHADALRAEVMIAKRYVE